MKSSAALEGATVVVCDNDACSGGELHGVVSTLVGDYITGATVQDDNTRYAGGSEVQLYAGVDAATLMPGDVYAVTIVALSGQLLIDRTARVDSYPRIECSGDYDLQLDLYTR